MTRVWIAAFAAATANAVLADTKLYIRGAAADPTVLVPPSPPDFQRDYAIELFQGGLEGLSIPQSGSYLGFSIELSQANRIIGSNSSTLAIPFLNHIQNVAARVGSVRVRVGGSTQDNSRLEYNTLPDESGSAFRVLEPQTAEGKTYVYVEFSPDAIQVLANVGEQVKTEWFLGLNFQDWWDTSNKAQVAGLAESMLGSSLGGIALGNEPDLYALDGHGKRPAPYTFDKYFEEWGSVASALSDNSNFTNPNILMGPSTCCRSSNPEFDNEDMAAAGYFSRFDKELKIATVTRYPTNNCGISPHRAQEEFADFLSHSLLSEHAAAYANYSRIVQAAGKPLYMLETNTAACGGFPGVSDSFGAGLWAVDWALKLATYNFSSTFLHTGGLTDYYNPFTPPPANESTFHQWTTGPVYYSSLVVAELFGKSGKSQIVDLNANQGENLTPGYAVYEDGVPTRVLLINYADDPAGAHDATARISIGGSNGQGSLTPKQVRVKYLSAPSVSSKGNITWAGQTLGNAFESDGRMKGQEIVETVSCDASINSCIVPLKAPSLALVFLSEAAYQNSAPSSNVSYSFKANIKGSQGNNSGSNQESSATMDGPLGLGAFAGLMAGAVALAVCLRW